ncbi:MAG: ATP-binding protein [Bacteroidales bacterium]|nr:ATP-binding protein [Bacteroidales bacterium]
MIKKIAITGPESTGKSFLAEKLARHFHTVWVPEFARVFIDHLDRDYSYDDILFIAKSQMESEAVANDRAKDFLFCDTELIVTKIWCEYKYGKCHQWILDNLEKSNYDLYLLLNIDLPWQPDSQREHPDNREKLFDLYLKELNSRGLPFEIIDGNGEERMQKAIKIIDQRFWESINTDNKSN